jgi:hypothetical protein
MPRVSAGKLIPCRLACAEDFTLQLKVLPVEQTSFDDESSRHQQNAKMCELFVQCTF